MNISSLNRVAALLWRLFDPKSSTEPFLKFEPTGAEFENKEIVQPFLRSTPEEQGVPSSHIKNMLDALDRDKTLFIHGIMVIRNGRVICEATRNGFDFQASRTVWSSSKSVTMLAIGLLISEGKLSLSDRVVDILSDRINPFDRIKYGALTVSDLLTMRSGATFNEATAMCTDDWIKGFFTSAIKGNIGKTFNYNSLNSYILAAIIAKTAGESVTDYLMPRLLDPMGIENFYWEKCPKGIEKGGWGIHARMEDMAKFGQLILNRGEWNGRQLVSAEWISEACRARVRTPQSCGAYNYGYHIWVGRKADRVLINGMFGQNVLCFRNNGIIVATAAGNDEVFQSGNMYKIIHRALGGEYSDTLPPDEKACSALREACRDQIHFHRVDGETGLPAKCKLFAGKSFVPSGGSEASIGIIPVCVQATSNNYTKGLKKIAFRCENGGFAMKYCEQDEEYDIKIGFGFREESVIRFHGETMRVRASGDFAEDEDDRTVLKLEIAFPETPSVRFIRIYLDEKEAEIKHTERPGLPIIEHSVSDLKEEFEAKPVIGGAVSKLDNDYLLWRAERVFAPSVRCRIEKDAEVR